MIYSLGTKQNLELLAYCVQSQSNDISGGKKKKKYSVYCRKPSKKNRKLMLKRPALPDDFQGRVFRSKFRVSVEAYGFFLIG